MLQPPLHRRGVCEDIAFALRYQACVAICLPPGSSSGCHILPTFLLDISCRVLPMEFSAGVTAAPVLGPGFVIAAPGATCQATCSSNSQTPAFLNNFFTDASTYLCAANFSGQAWVPGYQTTEPHCAAVYNGNAVNATSYACLCLTPQQTPGLEPSTGAQSCDQTCAQTLEGQIGTAVRTDVSTPLYTCLPSSEAGVHNRFGVADDQIMPYTPGVVASDLSAAAGVEPVDENSIPCSTAALPSTTDYSCFCTFQPPSGSPTVSSSSSASTSTATAGRKLFL